MCYAIRERWPDMKIVGVASVGDAIRELENRDYDILWLDILLEGGTAWQVLEDAFGTDRLPLNVILCSGNVDIEKRHSTLLTELWKVPGLTLRVEQKPVSAERIYEMFDEIMGGK